MCPCMENHHIRLPLVVAAAVATAVVVVVVAVIVMSTLLVSECYVTTDGQPASLSWNKAPIWALRPDLDYSQTVTVLILWGALSDERTGLFCVYAAGPCQRSHYRVRVPLDSRPYFTVSDSRLPFSSPPTTRRVMVEVFDPASTRVTPTLLLHNLYMYVCIQYVCRCLIITCHILQDGFWASKSKNVHMNTYPENLP
jgi:hypothetical protein